CKGKSFYYSNTGLLPCAVKKCIFDTYLILFQNFSLHHTPQKYQLNGRQTILEYRLLEFLSAKIS
ncbi:MAG: hypothetical protein OSJ56_12620, partial [Prevotella sp.]|nr:hypothetical protein [Prevotella sp.]